MAVISTSFLKQGSCGSDGNVHTCVRYGVSSVATNCDIGGTGTGTSYRNGVLARFSSLPQGIMSATLTVTYQQSGSDYWSASQTLSARACGNFTNATTGAQMPALYGTAASASLAGSSASVKIDVTDQIRTALENGSKCLWIYANAANNRKRVSSVSLSYEALRVKCNGQNVQSIVYNGAACTGLNYNGTKIF